MEIDNIYNMDCLEGMKQIPDGTIDAVICDLPYGTTSCTWDSVIPFDELWREYNRITKPTAPIVLFGSQPFTSVMIMSARTMAVENSKDRRRISYEKDYPRTIADSPICLGNRQRMVRPIVFPTTQATARHPDRVTLATEGTQEWRRQQQPSRGVGRLTFGM